MTHARSHPDPTAVILAAGLGSRLGGDASDEAIPKPLQELAGKPLLGRTLESLYQGGVRRAVVVVGWRGNEVAAAARRLAPDGLAVEHVVNPDYRLQNGVSVLKARERVTGNFVLTMSDHLLSPEIIRLALAADPGPDGAVLCIDRRIDAVFDIDDATKVLTDDAGRIRQIHKQLPEYNAIDTGVFHCSQGLMQALAATFARQGDCSLSDGIGALARQGVMRTADIGELFWLDVDTPESRAHGEEMLQEK